MDLFAVVLAQLFFLLLAPRPNWFFDITRWVLAADHKANLAGRIGRYGRVCVLGDGEDFFACLFQLRDEAQMQPLVLSYNRMKKSVRRLYDAHGAVTSCVQWETEVSVDCSTGIKVKEGLTTLRGDHTTFFQRCIQQLKIRFLEQGLCRSFRVGGIGNDDIEFILFVFEEFEAVADVNFDGRVLEANRHARKVFLG